MSLSCQDGCVVPAMIVSALAQYNYEAEAIIFIMIAEMAIFNLEKL